LKLVAFLLARSKAHVALSIIIGVLSGACSAALMGLINSSLISATLPPQTLAWRFAGFVVAVLATSYFSRLLLINLSERATFEMRLMLCREVTEAPLRRLEEVGGHRILAALTSDINVVAAALLNIPAVFINLAILVGCMVYLGWLSRGILAVLLVFLAVSVTTVQLIQRRGMYYMKLAREEWDTLVKHFRALTDGIKELKLHRRRREDFLSDFVEATARTGRAYEHNSRKVYAIANSWSQVLYFIFIGVVLFVLPHYVPIGLREMSGYILTVLYLRAPILTLLDIVPSFKSASVSLQKIEELGVSLKRFGAERERGAADAGGPAPVRLRLEGVKHSFYRERDERNFVLGPLDLTLPPGELVFVVGGNGSGKTTLAKLLCGLYVPEAGEVWMGDERVTDDNRDRYRELFSAVFSDFHLFEQLLGLGDVNLDGRARGYLSTLHLDHKVTVRDGVLSTTELSRGQRKRLALLTAYLEDRPIYIFDEWAADQDPEFKEIFYLRLLPELKARGKTTVVISHDDKYYHVADRVLKIDYGRLAFDTEVGPDGLDSLPASQPVTLGCGARKK
jgi:putative pyoverdin transport system ATP-binding/permease protein